MMRKLAKNALTAIALCAAAAAYAGDIFSIDALYGPVYGAMNGGKSYYESQATPLTIGETLTIRVRLLNASREDCESVEEPSWKLTGGSEGLRPQLGLSVGGVLRWADLVSCNPVSENARGSQLYFTDLIFQYTVRPGDLAQPVGLMNNSYSELVEGDTYLIEMNSASFQGYDSDTDSSRAPGWQFCSGGELSQFKSKCPPASGVDEIGTWRDDKTLNMANVHIKTIDFDSSYHDASADPMVWRVIHKDSTQSARYGNPSVVIDAAADYSSGSVGYATMYVWSKDETKLIPVGDVRTVNDNGTERHVLAVKISTGDTAVPFMLKAVGDVGDTAEVCLSSSPTTRYHPTTGEPINNTVSRFVTIGERLAPNVTVSFGGNSWADATAGSNYKSESAPLEMLVSLSETFPEKVTVTVKPVLRDENGDEVDVYEKHIIGSDTSPNAGNGWLKRETVLEFEPNADVEKQLYIFPLGATSRTPRDMGGIEFEVTVEPASADAFFEKKIKGVLGIRAQQPEAAAMSDPCQFIANRGRTVEIEVDDGYRNMLCAEDASGIAAGGTNLWRVVWNCNDDDDPDAVTQHEFKGLVPGISAVDPEKRVLTLKDIRYPDVGEYESVVTVVNPDGRQTVINVNAEVGLPRTAVATPDRADMTYCEGETAEIRVSITKKDVTALYAFIEPVNEDATNGIACASLVEEGVKGVEIERGKTETIAPFKVSLLDGDTTPSFRIQLSTNEYWTAETVPMDSYEYPRTTLIVTNKPPCGITAGGASAMLVGGGEIPNGGVLEYALPVNNAVTLKYTVDDVRADLQFRQQQAASAESAFKKWLEGDKDDDPEVVELVEKGIFLTKWQFKNPAGRLVETVITCGTRNGSVSLSHEFTATGTNTVEVQMLDKDMIAALLDQGLERAEIAAWSGVTYDDEDGRWTTDVRADQWGPKYTVRVPVTERPHVLIVPRNIYEGGWDEDKSGSNYGFDIKFAEQQTAPVKARIKVSLERTAAVGGITDIKKLGTLSLESVAGGKVVMTEDNPDPDARCIFVEIKAGNDTPTSSHRLDLVDIDGTQLSRYRLKAEVVTETKNDDGIPLNEYFEPDYYPFEIRNLKPDFEEIIGVGYDPRTGASTNVVTVSLNEKIEITWRVDDYVSFDKDVGSGLKVSWYSSEPGSRKDFTEKLTGTWETRFSASGDQRIVCSVTDKDGASSSYEWHFFVMPSKRLYVYPVGPRTSTMTDTIARYTTASGIGSGIVEANGSAGGVEYFCQGWDYQVGQDTARAYGLGLRAGAADAPFRITRDWRVDGDGSLAESAEGAFTNPDDVYDSFFYAAFSQTPDDTSRYETNLIKFEPKTGSGTRLGEAVEVVVALPKEEKDAVAYDSRHVEMIFSREWRELDNCGDINQDGIPDIAVKKYGLGVYDQASGAFASGGRMDLANIPGFNEDEDYLPQKASSGNSIIPNIAGAWEDNGGRFTALLEIRGFGNGLNAGYREADGSAPAPDYEPNEKRAWLAWKELKRVDELAGMGDADVDALFNDNLADATDDLALANATGGSEGWTPERPSDPIESDMDEDGLPDGYEYWFWYGAKVGYTKDGRWQGPMKGRRFNIDGDFEVFEEIPSAEILGAFDPQVASSGISTRDFDGDGLTDLEELAIGTSPVDCDTDGDGVPDGYEVMWGMNPIDGSDATGNPSNPDGDKMATAGPGEYRIVTFESASPVTGMNMYYMYVVSGIDALRQTITGARLAASSFEPDVNDYTMSYRGGTTLIKGLLGEHETVSVADVANFSVTAGGFTLYHDQVYRVFGFDPTTAWARNCTHGRVSSRWCAQENEDELKNNGLLSADFAVKHTAGLTQLDEYLWGKYNGVVHLPTDRTVLDVLRNSCTNPNAAFDKAYGDWSANLRNDVDGGDTDNDGVPDGWTMYVGGDPITPQPGSTHFGAMNDDGDDLVNSAEYAGLESSGAYPNCSAIADGRPSSWFNKFWPTDPGSDDTDDDGIDDAEESAFTYTPDLSDDGKTVCFRGGGLNPCTADTDFDNLPDAWESKYSGSVFDPAESDLETFYGRLLERGKLMANDGVGLATYSPSGPYVVGGMDPTYGSDAYTDITSVDARTGTVRDFDFDGDGLENYQEYLVQSVRCWRYDDILTPLNGRGLIYEVTDATNASYRLSEPVEGGNIPMNIFSGKQFFDDVRNSPLYDAYVRDNPLFDGMAEFPYDRLGYFAPCSRWWDPMRTKSGYGAVVIVDLGDLDGLFAPARATTNSTGSVITEFGAEPDPGICWMRPPMTIRGVEMINGSARRSWTGLGIYATTDPRSRDTDNDGMDDYWEIYHGLNPIFGMADPLALNYLGLASATSNAWSGAAGGFAFDPVVQPWTLGHPDADPDGDGLRNRDEAITGNMTSPTTYHTDPTPLWMTDTSSARSYASQYYRRDVVSSNNEERVTAFMFYKWPAALLNAYAGTVPGMEQVSTAETNGGAEDGRDYFFSFERNEGYDTDGDWRGDGHEVARLAMSTSDPLRNTDPDRRSALYLPGADACAYSVNNTAVSANGYDVFRQFTVECWVKPEEKGREQTIVERGFSYLRSNLVNTDEVWRVNFRLALDETGCVFGMFDNDNAVPSGSYGNGSECVKGDELPLNEWSHVAMSYNGSDLVLYVDGLPKSTTRTSLIPANGVLAVLQDPAVTNKYPNADYYAYRGANIVGAHRNSASFLWRDVVDPATGDTAEKAGFDQLGQYLKGWVSEVRFWDGARSASEIKGAYKTRMTAADCIANRKAVYDEWRKDPNDSATHNDNDGKDNLPAQLRVLYNFQQLPAAVAASDVSQLPSGFEQGVIANSGLPAGQTEIAWWSESPLRSTVYADAHVVPKAQNIVATLPLLDSSFLDSMFWSESYAGYVHASEVDVESYKIPNGGNPYGDSYYRNELELGMWRRWRKEAYRGSLLSADDSSADGGDEEDDATSQALNDMSRRYRFDARNRFVGLDALVPLGGAYARVDKSFWDEYGASTAWSDTGADIDGDDLPDWWEACAAANYGAPDEDTLNAATVIDYMGDKMPAWQAYMRDLARGMQPRGTVSSAYASTADADGDGLVDWWQNIYSIRDGANGDADGDGLANYVEYLLSEVFNIGKFSPICAYSMNPFVSDYFYPVGSTYVGEIFTDHDCIDDQWEDGFSNEAVSRLRNDAFGDYDADGWSNYAESQTLTDPTKLGSIGIEGATMKEFPVPMIEAKLTYEGTQTVSGKKFIVKAWRNRAGMDYTPEATPDAVWTIGGETAKDGSEEAVNGRKLVGKNPGRQITIHLSPGSVIAGTVTLEFKDMNWKLYYLRTMQEYGTEANTAVWEEFASDSQRSDDPTKGYIMWKWSNTRLGEIDYETGTVTLDFDRIAGERVGITGNIATKSSNGNWISVYEVDNCYVRANWNSKPVTIGASATYYLTDADEPSASNNSLGHVREGRNKFIAFCDIDGDGSYTAGEPFGAVDGVDVGWEHGYVDIELTDTSPMISRFSVSADAENDRATLWGAWSGNLEPQYITAGTLSGGIFERVRIVRTFINGQPCADFGVPDRVVLDKTLNLQNSPYITEADILDAENLDLDWQYLADDIARGNVNATQGGFSNITYRVVLGNGTVAYNEVNNLLNHAFNRWFDPPAVYHSDARPVQLGPGVVTTCSPTFSWSIPNSLSSYTAFEIVVLDSSGAEVWDSGQLPLPPRVRDVEHGWRYEYRAPLFVNSIPAGGSRVFANDSDYTWYVSVFNSLYKNDDNFQTKGAQFRMNVVTNAVDCGSIRVAARYFGPSAVARSGIVRVQAFRTPDFNGMPVGEACISDVATLTDASGPLETGFNATIIGLEAGTYYIRAFIDTEADGQCAWWESRGYACERDVPGCSIYTPTPVKLGPELGFGDTVVVYIEDGDTDQDNLPDAWEWVQKGDLSSLGVGELDQSLFGAVAVKRSLSGALSGSGTLTAGLAARLSGALASPYLAAAIMGVDVAGAESEAEAASLVNQAVSDRSVRTVRVDSIAVDSSAGVVRMEVSSESGRTAGVDDRAVSALYEFEADGDVTVRMRVWRKGALADADWTEIEEAARDVTVGADVPTVAVPIAEGVDLGSGFFKITLEKK